MRSVFCFGNTMCPCFLNNFGSEFLVYGEIKKKKKKKVLFQIAVKPHLSMSTFPTN